MMARRRRVGSVGWRLPIRAPLYGVRAEDSGRRSWRCGKGPGAMNAAKGKLLAIVLLVRGRLEYGESLTVADGYQRI